MLWTLDYITFRFKHKGNEPAKIKLYQTWELNGIAAALQVNHEWINKGIRCKVVCMTPHHMQTISYINFASHVVIQLLEPNIRLNLMDK